VAQEIYAAGAAQYADKSRTDDIYVRYERPAIRALAGEVRGLRVLDLGCGPGDHLPWLLEGGAKAITAVDESAEMIAICRERHAGVELHCADFSRAMPFLPDGTFDLAVSSLALHYVRDWSAPLRELRRVLGDDGRVVISTHHPFSRPISALGQDYCSIGLVRDRFEIGGELIDVEYYHRPMHAIAMPFIEAGFGIERIAEPPYAGEATFLFLAARATSGR
jgi:ubiquinone/menaquinone biosynthesis C-methylase UbiE